jgi:phosphatidylserine/phosphatidylglycerophosphate/cardiolipin synthase-like enzyme
MTITTAVSPDCGLDTLDRFLAATKSSLVIGMYDFTSGPILDTFGEVLKGGRTLQMVLDNPALNPTASQSDPETVQTLQGELGGRFHFEWALERNDRHVNAWEFPSAYHIKVIVRDGTATWLSSGILNNSNEPDLDAPPKTEDRDWHVIVENQKIAETFSAFIQHDFQVASQHQAEAPDDVQSAVRRSMLKLADSANPLQPPPLSFAPRAVQAKSQTFQNQSLTITPLLTPDNFPTSKDGQYLSEMLALMKSARKSLDFQLRYVEVPKDDDPGDLKNLLLAIKALVDGFVKVRVMQSLQFGEKWAEQMGSMPDIDLTSVMKLQPNVHNKGFVIDSEKVVMSSRNWSGQGVRLNRDAGMIIESAPIAQYFEKVFDADWTKSKPLNPAGAAAKQRSSRRR